MVTGVDRPVAAGIALWLGKVGADVAVLVPEDAGEAGVVGDVGGVDGGVDGGEVGAVGDVVGRVREAGGRAASFPASFTSRPEVAAAFDGVVGALGPVDALVHAAMDAKAFERCGLADIDDRLWASVWEQTMRTTLFCFQEAASHMPPGGGRIVVVTTTLSMSGAAELVPYTAASEGQRVLAKSAARQWGPRGITVNCVAPSPALAMGKSATDEEGFGVSLAPRALAGDGQAESDLGPVVEFLVGDAGHFVTGATLCVDGGEWMAP